MCPAKYVLKKISKELGRVPLFIGLHLRIWCNTAKPDVNPLLHNIYAWFVLRVKKERQKSAWSSAWRLWILLRLTFSNLQSRRGRGVARGDNKI